MKSLISFILMTLLICGGSVYWITDNLKKEQTQRETLLLKELETQRNTLISELKALQPIVLAKKDLEIEKLNETIEALTAQNQEIQIANSNLNSEISSMQKTIKETYRQPDSVTTSYEKKISQVYNKNLVQFYTGYGRTSTKITETPSSFNQTDQNGFLFGAGYSREVIKNYNIGISVFSNENIFLQTGWGF